MSATLFDTNVWIAAVFPSHPFHRLAATALQQATAAEPAVFCRATEQSFLRLASTPVICKSYGADGFTNRDALATLLALQALPQVTTQSEPPGTVGLWHSFAGLATASPRVWMDAYLAAFAKAGSLAVTTLDSDFNNFVRHGLDLRLLAP